MSRYTTTPWRHHTDLLTIRSQLYPPSPTLPDTRAQAVSRILAWKLRGNLPHALESTALLVDAILHHHTHAQSSLFSIRAVYAAAFTRFVTGFCDIGRNRERSLEPSSMLEIARQIDMPAEFVALRHEATHEELPSLRRLVGVTEEALGWLWRVYWSGLDEGGVTGTGGGEVGGDVDVQVVGGEARKWLKGYSRAMRQALKSKTGGAKEKEDAAQSCVTSIVGACKNQPAALAAIANVLVDDKMLYPGDREIDAPMQGAYLLWDSLLLQLCSQQSNCLLALLEALFAAMTRHAPDQAIERDAGKAALHLWLLHIACSDVWLEARRDSALDSPAWLIKQCCLQPSHWSYKLGETLLEEGDAVFAEAWSDLLEASDVGASATDEMDVEAVDGAALSKSLEGPIVDDESPDPGWRIALMPPSLPIGVV